MHNPKALPLYIFMLAVANQIISPPNLLFFCERNPILNRKFLIKLPEASR